MIHDDPVLSAIDKEIAGLEAQLAESVPPNPFCCLIHDKDGALSNAEEAVAAIEAEYEARESGKPSKYAVIAPRIKDAVVEALAAAHPANFERGRLGMLCRVIVASHRRDEAVPVPQEGDGPPSPGARMDDAAHPSLHPSLHPSSKPTQTPSARSLVTPAGRRSFWARPTKRRCGSHTDRRACDAGLPCHLWVEDDRPIGNFAPPFPNHPALSLSAMICVPLLY